MSPVRILFLLLCAAILGGGYYLSSQGIWGASAGVTSIRTGSGGMGGVGRVK
ncbi:hypothetical protein [Marinibacterium profundimaris]|uniref:hypothetical protein n=1 Tax=Marinibacterium profundimaris TaxID=1679460 RepID=UPI0013030E21|nr:hypothetical protein [Marinibacterium profundimaris]